jgi:hypothetical protein
MDVPTWKSMRHTFYFDLNEPFFPVRIDVTLFEKEARSPSFPRELKSTDPSLHRVIEYAIY